MFTKCLSIFLALAAVPSLVKAARIKTCQDQSPCLRFTYEALATSECSGEKCDYQICMILDLGGHCKKNDDDDVSHTCEKPNDMCLNGGGFKGMSDEVEDLEDGYTSCQIVPPGGVAEFLLKDGSANGCGNKNFALGGGSVPVSCETLGVMSCTGGGNIGKECVWRVQAPTACGKTGSGSGDPHFKLWNRIRYSYHGECDLVFLKSMDFADGRGLDLHIRTTIKDFYSYIETVALRIGTSVLELSDGKFWINGQEGSDYDLPLSLSGFTMLPPYPLRNSKAYEVHLNQGDKILFRTYKHYLSISVSGNSEDFGDSVGLLGNYATSEMLARDGKTIIHDVNAFGQEWQVQGEESMLFRDAREPQHPHAKCTIPAIKMEERQLRDPTKSQLIKAAESACAGKSLEDIEFCIFDVVATGDLGMAGAW